MATQKAITVDQGSQYREQFTVEVLTDPLLPYNATTNPYIPLNLTDYEANMMVRTSFDAASPVLSFSTTGISPALVITALTGIITLTIPASVTSAVSFKGEQVDYLYDLEITDVGGVIHRAGEGTFTIRREITR